MAISLVFIMSKSFVYTVINGRSSLVPSLFTRRAGTRLRLIRMAGIATPTYFALCARRDIDHTHFVGRSAGRCAASIPHAHGAVPDYIIDYRSKRTCSIKFQSRFRDFCQGFKISGKISRFRARFQARFQRFQDFRQDFMQDFKISVKISIETYEISRVPSIFSLLILLLILLLIIKHTNAGAKRSNNKRVNNN